MRTGILIATVFLLTQALVAAAQPAIRRLDGSTLSPAEVDAAVSRLMTAAQVPGLGIAVFNSGKVAYLKTYRFRDSEKRVPLTENSDSKTMTRMATTSGGVPSATSRKREPAQQARCRPPCVISRDSCRP